MISFLWDHILVWNILTKLKLPYGYVMLNWSIYPLIPKDKILSSPLIVENLWFLFKVGVYI